MITVSVVSHNHGDLVRALIADLEALGRNDLEIILTVNVPETLRAGNVRSTPLTVLRNARPKGFAENHNAAFRRANGEYFCVLNPDIGLPHDPFPALLQILADRTVAVAGPQILDPGGRIEDSVRRFPTLGSLLRRLTANRQGPDYALSAGPTDVDWVGGMFMLFHRAAFKQIGGFDERYFLYYEDVDICRRLHKAGYRVVATAASQAIHEARRASRRDPRHMAMHARSMLRFLTGI